MKFLNCLNGFVAVSGAALLAVASGGAHAASSTAYIEGASVPFALAYGTCVYGASSAAACTAEREELLAEADTVLDRFYFAKGLEARRSLVSLFDDMDRQADKFRSENKTLAPETLALMDCVSTTMRGQDDFARGVSVRGTQAFEDCRATYDAYLQRDRSSNAVQRNVNYMRYIRRILPDAPVASQRIHKEGLLIERGPRD